MRKPKKARKLLVKEVNFKIGRGKCLVVWINSNLGLDRVIVTNKNGVVEVMADGHTKFEFEDRRGRKESPSQCDFWLGNLKWKRFLADYLDGCFWSQFTWGGLFANQKNRKLKKAINTEIKRLVEEFESDAAKRLNALRKKLGK